MFLHADETMGLHRFIRDDELIRIFGNVQTLFSLGRTVACGGSCRGGR